MINSFNVDQSCQNAALDTEKAILALGKTFFEANKDNPSSEFIAQIDAVKDCMEKENLWNQYKLSLEGKMLCESCGSIITSDSMFCNKCGSSVKMADFSPLGLDQVQEDPLPPVQAVCPACGAPLVEDALFCEKCGHKL